MQKELYAEASVWTATSDDVPGLSTEAKMPEILYKERMACQGRVAALLGWSGPQRSEDTGQVELSLDMTVAIKPDGEGAGKGFTPCSPTPRGQERGLGLPPNLKNK